MLRFVNVVYLILKRLRRLLVILYKLIVYLGWEVIFMSVFLNEEFLV